MFMFLLPNADLESVTEKPVRYREASALFQALLDSLTYRHGGCAGEEDEAFCISVKEPASSTRRIPSVTL